MAEQIIVYIMAGRDVQAVWEIEKMCFPHPWSLKSFYIEIEENQCTRYFVAKYQEKVVGYGGMWLIVDEAHVTNVAVHQDYRRQGVARSLMKALIEEAVALDIDRMTLEVRISNHAAISLYEKLGFKEAGIRKRYYPDNQEDALIMWNLNIGGIFDAL